MNSVKVRTSNGHIIITGKVKNKIVAEQIINTIPTPPTVEGFSTASNDPAVHRITAKVNRKTERVLQSLTENK